MNTGGQPPSAVYPGADPEVEAAPDAQQVEHPHPGDPDADIQPDISSVAMRRELRRRVRAEHVEHPDTRRPAGGGRHARHDEDGPASGRPRLDYVPRHAVSTPGPSAVSANALTERFAAVRPGTRPEDLAEPSAPRSTPASAYPSTPASAYPSAAAPAHPPTAGGATLWARPGPDRTDAAIRPGTGPATPGGHPGVNGASRNDTGPHASGPAPSRPAPAEPAPAEPAPGPAADSGPRAPRSVPVQQSPDPPAEQSAPVKRVRVVLSQRKGTPRPVRTVVDVQELTQVGEVLSSNLIRSQLALALRVGGVALIALGSLPAIFVIFPVLGRVEFFGMRLPWLLLGVLAYPFMLLLGYLHARSAERLEQIFADHIQG